MRESREKGAGMRDQDPPFQTLYTGIGKTRQKAAQNIFKLKPKTAEHTKKKQ